MTSVAVKLAPGITASKGQIIESGAFQDWLNRSGPDWQGEVTINAVEQWPSGVINLLQVTIARKDNPRPTFATWRSETVDVLVTITDGTDDERVVFVEQERDATACRVISNVAGGKKWDESERDAAKRETYEELDLENIRTPFRIDFIELLPPILATPGTNNERVYMMQAMIQVTPGNLKKIVSELKGRKTGVSAEGEDLTAKVIPRRRALRVIATQPNPDGKTLLSLAWSKLHSA